MLIPNLNKLCTTTMKMARRQTLKDWGVEHRLGRGDKGDSRLITIPLIDSLIIDTSDIPYIGLILPLSNNSLNSKGYRSVL